MGAVKKEAGEMTSACADLGTLGSYTKKGREGSNWSHLEASERFEVLSVIQGHYGGWVWNKGLRKWKLVSYSKGIKK